MANFFDELSKQAGKAVSRRDALRVTARGIFGLLLASTPVGKLWRRTLASQVSAQGSLVPSPLFGPKVFVRGFGAPTDFVESFNLEGSASEFTLIVQNGNSSGSQRITAAWIWLNGILVVRPDDFDEGEVQRINRPVALLPTNDLKIRLAGKPGGLVTVSVSALVGGGGGFVETANGAKLSIPPGALDRNSAVNLNDTTLLATGITLPPGYVFLQAVTVDLSGAQLTAEADLSIPANASLSGPFIVAQVLQLGSLQRLTLIDTASVGTDGLLHTDSPPFPGVRAGGTYMFLQMPSQIGILGVNAALQNGSPVTGALVTGVTVGIQQGVSTPVLNQALGSQTLFVGQTSSTGFAALPVLAANTTVMAITVAPGSSATQLMIGTGIIRPGPPPLPGAINKLTGRLNEVLQHQFLRVPPPSEQPPICSCQALAVNPTEIPAPDKTCFPVHAGAKLAVFCQTDDVTASTFTVCSDIISCIDELVLLIINAWVNGLEVHFTIYWSDDSTIASVDTFTFPGVVTGVSEGQTNIHVIYAALKLSVLNSKYFVTPCLGTGTVPVIVSVKCGNTCCDPPAVCCGTTCCDPGVVCCGTTCCASGQSCQNGTCTGGCPPRPNCLWSDMLRCGVDVLKRPMRVSFRTTDVRNNMLCYGSDLSEWNMHDDSLPSRRSSLRDRLL